MKNHMPKRNLFISPILIVPIAASIFIIRRNRTQQAPLTIINAGFESNPLVGRETAGTVEAGG